MNYAVDRLDRRDRFAATNDSTNESNGSTLSLDLKNAHSNLISSHQHHHHKHQDESDFNTTKQQERLALAQAQAHALAGRTLRDGGFCAQALFHFGMAWMYDVENPVAAGDYAQMVDLSGYPEIGALSLLYFHRGGLLKHTESQLLLSLSCTSQCDGETTTDIPNIFSSLNHNAVYHGNCGCGLEGCHSNSNSNKTCFLPFDKNDLEEVMRHLSLLSSHEHAFNEKDPSISSSLCFWNDKEEEKDDKCSSRSLPPVVKLLLLKLLYCNPVGGPFLQLACHSIAPLTRQIKSLEPLYKSHWAYFVLIQNVVNGWKVKPYRRDRIVPYHVPVKDILADADERRVFGGNANHSNLTFTSPGELSLSKQHKEEDVTESFVSYLRSILESGSHSYHNTTTTATTTATTTMTESQMLYPRKIQCFFQPTHRYHPPLFIVGDSHSLSIAWQTLHISSPNSLSSPYRTAIPYPATGIKAWHTSPHAKPFFTQYNFHTILSRLPSVTATSVTSVLVSMGEIDCREGIGGASLQGYKDANSHRWHLQIQRTVADYVEGMWNIARQYQLQLLLLPVAPHAYRSQKNGKSTGRARRRETMERWNECLRKEVQRRLDIEKNNQERHEVCIGGVFLLNYEEQLREANASSPTGYVLNKYYNADFTHMNSAFLPHLENAIVKCGCDLNLL